MGNAMRIDGRIASILGAACCVLGLQSGIASTASGCLTFGAVLYDQTSNVAASNGQDFEPGEEALDCQAADDFQLPSGSSWTITKVTTPGAAGRFEGESLYPRSRRSIKIRLTLEPMRRTYAAFYRVTV